jgi:outer membrane protein assembly factor BamB
MKNNLLLSFFVLSLFSCTQPPGPVEVAQWRGPLRDGIYPDTALLRVWPEEGPAMLWSYEGLGAGHSSPVVAGEYVYITGIPDTLTSEGVLFKFDLNGKLLWQKSYGPDWSENFPGGRSTPTVAGDLIYIESGVGVVHCLKASSGDKVWSVDFFADLAADSVQFGYSESVLIDGDRLICTPGGKTSNMVALDRFTGEVIWRSPGYGEPATYSSPILINHNENRLLVNLTATSIIGIDADSGEMFWRVPQFQDNKIHANTPIYHDGKVLVCSASRKDTSGLVLLQLSPDGRQAEILWRNQEILNLMGGVVLIDGHVYGSSYLQARWFCINFQTGETKYVAKDPGGGPVIWADGLFYCYAEREGEMVLADANAEEFKVISRFKVPLGTAEHWAHPVISNGMLLVRHGDAIMVYDIRDAQDLIMDYSPKNRSSFSLVMRPRA